LGASAESGIDPVSRRLEYRDSFGGIIRFELRNWCRQIVAKLKVEIRGGGKGNSPIG
jgi:hypothetical protein